MHKKGADIVLSIYWFVILFIVAGAVVYMAYLFYGSPYDIRNIESKLLGDQIADCMTSKGYLNSLVFTSQFQNNLTQFCHLNFNVEDVYGWKNQPQYYAEVGIYKFDQTLPGTLGDELLNSTVGDINLKTAWEFTAPSSQTSTVRSVNTIVIHATEGTDAVGAIETISQNGLSIHYMIDRDGNVISYTNENQFAPPQYQNAFQPESNMAQHAGCNIGTSSSGQFSDSSTTTITRPKCSSSCIDSDGLLDPSCQFSANPPQSVWCCIPGFNTNSIGIELVNLGPLCSVASYKNLSYCANSVSADGQQWETYTPAQITALTNLVSDIASRYKIPLDRDHIIGHYQITTYKSDPGPQFPWDQFMQQILLRGAVSISTSSSNLGQQERSFYVLDPSGNKYVVKILALVGKTEKNVAQ
ncbi:MAG: N-acetylmuramoyl-L-alanine amidase [Candidatus Nanoarchaeia archaeon]